MGRVSKRIAVLSLLVVLTGHAGLAATRGSDPTSGDGNWGSRLKHFIVAILDQLGLPKP